MDRTTTAMIRRLAAAAACIVMSALLLTSCGQSSHNEGVPAPEPAPGSGTLTGSESVIGNIPEGSILLFEENEGAARLNQDMEAGRIPAVCRAMYDQMGSRPEIEITDPDLITEMYNRFGHMIIGGESQESITDNYHYVAFTLQDGSTVSWGFEGTGLLCGRHTNYTVLEAGTIWARVKEMQDELRKE